MWTTMCVFSLAFKMGEDEEYFQLRKNKRKNANDTLAVSISLTWMCAVGFFNDLFVRSLDRSLDIRQETLQVLVFSTALACPEQWAKRTGSMKTKLKPSNLPIKRVQSSSNVMNTILLSLYFSTYMWIFLIQACEYLEKKKNQLSNSAVKKEMTISFSWREVGPSSGYWHWTPCKMGQLHVPSVTQLWDTEPSQHRPLHLQVF